MNILLMEQGGKRGEGVNPLHIHYTYIYIYVYKHMKSLSLHLSSGVIIFLTLLTLPASLTESSQNYKM